MCADGDGDGGHSSSVFSTKLKCLDVDYESTDLTAPPSTTSASSMSSGASMRSFADEDSIGSFRLHPGIILEGVDTNVAGNVSTSNSRNDSDVDERGWKSSGERNHHDGSPLIALRSASQRLIDPTRPGLQLGDDEVYRNVMLNARKLPKPMGGIVGLHVVLNNERIKHRIAPLQRMPALDEIAQAHAARMAANQRLEHCNLDGLLRSLVEKDDTRARRVGSNVSSCSGDVALMHERMMKESVSDRNNVLDRRYTKMGVATRKGSNGTLYVCQIFIG
jgi:Cysteine-rich secretory protein family